MDRYQILLKEEKRNISNKTCSKGGEHVWGIDGAHSNEYCKKCFIDRYHHKINNKLSNKL